MKTRNAICVLMLMAVTGSVWAYGGSSTSSIKKCTQPKFKVFTPPDKSEVTANSSFSFKASAPTNPDSISVTIKGQPIAITITPTKNTGFDVAGTIPESAKGDFARINIEAEAMDGCKGSDGWLLSVAP